MWAGWLPGAGRSGQPCQVQAATGQEVAPQPAAAAPRELDLAAQAATTAPSQQDQAMSRMLTAWAADLRTVRHAVAEGYPPYDIFISHPGELKHTLVSGLRAEFAAGTRTFTDAWDLRVGDDSHADMIKACGTTRVGVVVISRESVAKKWPMRELHLLVHRHRRREVGLVVVLWYNDFADFEAVVKSYERQQGHLRLWASLLRYLKKHRMVIKGPLTERRGVPEVAREASVACMRLLRRVYAAEAMLSVGFEEQAGALVEEMRMRKWVWLHGHGGLGKTKMATQLQHELWEAGLIRHVAFIALEFTAGSGPTLSKEEALHLLSKAVHSLEGMDCSGESAAETRRRFAAAATRPETLIVIDNVHSQEQLGLLLEGVRLDCVPFVAFTSRLREPTGGSDLSGLWTQVQPRLHRHAMQPLTAEPALQLFRERRGPRPAAVPEALEAEVVGACGGLPLALLIVAGALIGQEDEDAWKAAAQAMQVGKDPADAVLAESEFGLQRMVEHSLLSLTPQALSMFLDTACVLSGHSRKDALITWQQWHGEKAGAWLRQLVNRNLLVVDDNEVLRMHDVLRWYGRRLVRGEARLAGQQQHHGTRVWVHCKRVEPQVPPGDYRRILAATLRSFSAAPAGTATHAAASYDDAELELGNLASAQDLSEARVLLMEGHGVWERWNGGAWVRMPSLLWLSISSCMCPDLGAVLSGSPRLCILSLMRIDNLRALPESLGQLVPLLQELSVVACTRFTHLPESIGQLAKLRRLSVTMSKAMTTVPESVGNLSALQELRLGLCSNLRSLPQSVLRLSSLHTLNLSLCCRLAAVPEGLLQLPSLQTTHLKGSALPGQPSIRETLLAFKAQQRQRQRAEEP